MSPTKTNPASGIFVTRRLAELKKRGIEIRSFSPFLADARGLERVKKVFGREKNPVFSSFSTDTLLFEQVPARQTVMDCLIAKIDAHHTHRVFAKALLRHLPPFSPDLVHAHWVYPHGTLAVSLSRKLRVPSVITAHGSDIHSFPHENESIWRETVESLEAADRIIFVSEYLKKAAMTLGYSGKNAVVITNGVDLEKFRPMNKVAEKKNLGIAGPCVGFVGNLVPIKRADRLAELFSAIHTLVPDAEFLVVGNGPLRNLLEQRCAEMGLKAHFTGQVEPDRVPRFMNAMDVLVLPSRNEGWGCVAVEAQACGIPVVGSGNGGIPEAIGDGGFIVPEGEDFETRFALSTVKMLKHPIPVEALLERANQFSWASTVEREIDLYRTILA
jgi:glycosyltransferase involved in cell wall biosynthesis